MKNRNHVEIPHPLDNVKLNVSPGFKASFLKKKSRDFVNRNTILYGASESGKSTVLLEMLYLMKNIVPLIFVFAPTAEDNGAYDGIVPPKMIHLTFDIKLLEKIFARQSAATKIYKAANNTDTLRELFEMVANDKLMKLAKVAYTNAATIVKRKESDSKLSFTQKKHDVKSVETERDDFLRMLFKFTISRHRKYLKTLDLEEKYKYSIKYLYFNPQCILVFDDCGAELATFQKHPLFKNIFYLGRHKFMNIILTLQDDKGLDSTLKKNAFVNVFTTQQCADAYFVRKSNNFNAALKKRASETITKVFEGRENVHHRKLIYIRKDPEKLKYTVADVYKKFKFGTPAMWAFSDELAEGTTMNFSDDPLLSSFKLDL